MSEKVPRIPLEERIGKVGIQEPDFLKVFYLYTDDFFIGLSKISRDLYYAKRYENFIREMEGDESQLLVDCIYRAHGFTREDRNSLLYYTLVEPFANIPSFERS